MNILTIPSKFTLGYIPWTVEEVEYNPNEQYGLCYTGKNIISIANTCRRNLIPSMLKLSTFYHELSHAIISAIEWDNTTFDDEPLATLLGDALMELDLTRNSNELVTEYRLWRFVYYNDIINAIDFYKTFIKHVLTFGAYNDLANNDRFISLYANKVAEFCDSRDGKPIIYVIGHVRV